MNVFNIGGTRTLAAGVAVSAASVVTPVMIGSNAESAKVDLLDGAAWLSNETAANVVRVNAETGRVDARLELGEITSELLVAQADGVVLVSFAGQVRSIDLANLDWGAATQTADGLVVGDGAAYMVSLDGHVREVDPATLAAVAEIDLDATPGLGVVVDGRLVLPVDDGTVKVIDGDEVTAEVEAGDPGDALHVTRVGDAVAVLNQSQGTVRNLDAGSGDASDASDVELPSGELVVPRELPAGGLWAAATRSGELVGVDLDTGRTVAVPVVDGRHEVSPPAAAEGRVHLVDRTAAEIVTVDAESLDVVRREALGIDNASRVELLAEGDKVFVNDRASSLAIVIDGDEYTRVDKYRDESVAADTPPSDPPDPGPAPPPPPTGPPAAPVAVTATAGNASATVGWSPGGGPNPASAYHITYPGRSQPIEVPASQLTVAVDGLTNGESYAFEVWASNEHGESEHVTSNEVVPNDEVPGAPGRVRAEGGDAAATVTWAEADSRGNEITAYIVTPKPATVPPVRVGGDQTRGQITGLTNGVAYTFAVRAVNDLDAHSEASPPSNTVTPWGAPGQIPSAERSEGDGTVALAWEAAPSQAPVRYIITASPSAGDRVTTDGLEHTFTGLTNGTTYSFTIIPENERGQGPPFQVQATPGGQPTISNPRGNRVGDRRFEVTFAIDDGGRPVDSCTVTASGGGSTSCDVSGGSGAATLDVPLYNSDYTFTIDLENSMGSATPATTSGHSNGKPLVVEAETARWDGACTWPGHEGQRPRYGTANHECDTAIGWVDRGTTVRGLCHQAGGRIRDDYLNYSNQWVRVDRDGYMSTLYFENYTNTQAVISGLPSC